tara:strand:- start:2 stop:148 length:147 start_codon:yes stop_codon:yes gene_type:complete
MRSRGGGIHISVPTPFRGGAAGHKTISGETPRLGSSKKYKSLRKNIKL